jgi:AraC-like DNA-binding protein
VNAIAQKPILQLEQEPLLVPQPAEERGKTKYQRSTLNPEAAAAILQRMEAAMQGQKLYLEPELTLPMLAEAVQSPSYHVSQVLSEHLGKNFFEYVNTCRIEEAKQMLLDPKKQHYTILAIAFDSGFNSKTTFNKVFKRYTGQTPSEFVALQKEEKAIA